MRKYFFLITLLLSILILAFTFFKSVMIYKGNHREEYFFFYVIALSVFFISIISFFINEKVKEYLIISFISIFISLYLFEMYLTLNSNINFNNTPLVKMRTNFYFEKTGKKYDSRTPYKIYKDLKKENNQIVLRVYPKVFLYNKKIFPLSGISNSKTILCNENGYYSYYRSDRYGFNNPDKEWDSKQIEYLLIGDSFTHGSCVNRPNDIASVLRNLSNKSVINLGMGGNGTLIEYASLREYISTNVNKVLLIFVENDLININSELKNEILIKYIKDEKFTQNLKTKQSEINNIVKKQIEKEMSQFSFKRKLLRFIKMSNLSQKMNISTEKKFNQSVLERNKALLEFKKLLLLTKKLTNQNKSKLYFVYLPPWHRYNDPEYISNYTQVKNTVEELDIKFLDMHNEVFLSEPNPSIFFPFGLPGHYNEEGYRKVATEIYELTKDHNEGN